VESRAREQQQWVVQPLLDAGMEPERIRELVFRLAFEDIVSQGCGTLALVAELVADQGPVVQVAWAQTISRMLLLDVPP
jgi:hypothetical protein